MESFHFRLFVRPTIMGKAIITRLTAEGTDRQADARRWLELGHALEQAGFRLDGTTLFHGGRVVTAGQPAVVEVPVQVPPSAADMPQAVLQESAPPAGTAVSVTAAVHNGQSTAPAIEPPVQVLAAQAAPVDVPTPSTTASDASIQAGAVPALADTPVALADDMAANLRALSV